MFSDICINDACAKSPTLGVVLLIEKSLQISGGDIASRCMIMSVSLFASNEVLLHGDLWPLGDLVQVAPKKLSSKTCYRHPHNYIEHKFYTHNYATVQMFKLPNVHTFFFAIGKVHNYYLWLTDLSTKKTGGFGQHNGDIHRNSIIPATAHEQPLFASSECTTSTK